jgi:Bleomycin resistance protein-like N-terminal
MRVTGVTTNLPVADIDAARGFYTDYLGTNVEDLNLGWVARYRTLDGRACVQLVTRDATSPQAPAERVSRDARVVLESSEALLLGGGDKLSIVRSPWTRTAPLPVVLVATLAFPRGRD